MIRYLVPGLVPLIVACQTATAPLVAPSAETCPKGEPTPLPSEPEIADTEPGVQAGAEVVVEVDAAASEANPGETPAPWEDPQISIEAFDCVSALENKQGDFLRLHRGGGSEGAAWNWYGAAIVCTVRVASNCRGDAVVTVRVGRDYESGVAVRVGPGENDSPRVASVDFKVEAPHWERELSESPFSAYENLLLFTHVSARCTGPVGIRPETFDLTDSFVGRFSGGE